MSDSEMEDYGFDYSDEEPEDEDIDIENQYYNSKGLLEVEDEDGQKTMNEALQGFQQVLKMEDSKGEWGFKALKQIVKLQYRLGKHDEMLESYKVMLTYLESAVTKNAGEKKIHSLLDWISHAQNPALLQGFYTVTLEALAQVRNDRLWFKTQLKLAYLLFSSKEFDKLQKALDALYKACSGQDGVEDQRKGTQLLELYALEIQVLGFGPRDKYLNADVQVATEQKRMKKLAELYERALGVQSGIPHPRIMGIVRECGGKMHMRAHQWSMAATDFFEEAQAYRNEPEILAMTELVQAYRAHDIIKLEKILVKHKTQILGDSFIAGYLNELRRQLRSQVALQLVKPYTAVKLDFIAARLHIPVEDVEELLVALIMDDKIGGQIDQVNRTLVIRSQEEAHAEANIVHAIASWTSSLQRVTHQLERRYANS